jgi:phosphoglycerol transferase
LIITRRPRELASGGVVVFLILALSLASLAPAIAYRLQHGPNPEQVGERRPWESEYYSLRLTQLVLPLTHRIATVADARARYNAWSKTTGIRAGDGSAALGTAGTLGFLGLLGVLAASAIAGDGARPAPIYRSAAVAALAAFLVATMGGFSSFIGAVFPYLRGWDRLSIFIAFFALLAVGRFLDAIRGRLTRARRERAVAAGLVAAVLVLGVLDQTSSSYTPAYEEIDAVYQNDRRFVRRVEEQMPSGAAVFELPYADFPEGTTPGNTGGYDLLRPYLHSRDLRWSFGAVRGRPADWAARLAKAPLGRVLPAVSSVGFEGIYVDGAGYDDEGVAVRRELRKMLGVEPLESADKRFLFFDIRSYNRRLAGERSRGELERLRAATLRSAAG